MSIDEAMTNTFERWDVNSVPDWLTLSQKGKILAISLGLGTIFNEDREAERQWMQGPNAAFKSRPITMILAGRIDEVLNKVNAERHL